MNRKKLLNVIADGYEGRDPEYFKLYEDCRRLGDKTKYLTEDNQYLKIEIQNISKERVKLRGNFLSISEGIVKKRPVHCESNHQIKAKMKLNQLKSQIKVYDQSLKRLLEDHKLLGENTLEEDCLNMQLQQIDSNTLILKDIIKLMVMQNMQAKIPAVKDVETEVFSGDSEDQMGEVKGCKRECLSRYKAEAEALESEIDRELKVEARLNQNKLRNSEVLKGYHKLIEARGAERNKEEALSSQLRELELNLAAVKCELQSYNTLNEDLKSKISGKKDLELKENKNLREEIEKCADQCRDIRNKYFQLLEVKRIKDNLN